jgi:hypothetical protein
MTQGASSGEDRAVVNGAGQAVSAVPASVLSALPRIADAVPEGLTWRHEIIVRKTMTEYLWSLRGERGGIHVNAWPSSTPSFGCEWSGGIEGHSPVPREYDRGTPSHEHCWLLGGPCWHDGSSLQFSEQIAPYLPNPGEPLDEDNHLDVLRVMLRRYDCWLPTAQAIEARRAETTGSVHESAVGETDASDAALLADICDNMAEVLKPLPGEE